MTRYRRILLIIPRYKDSRYRPVLQAGVGYIAESLYENNIQYKYLDMGFSDSKERLVRLLNEYKPDLVGISMLTFRYRDHYKLAEEIKAISPSSLICVGGAHTALFADKILEDCPALDLVFKGESEKAVVDLCLGKPFSEIGGLVYKDNGRINSRNNSELIYNLDSIPYPKYRQFPLGRYINKDFNILPVVSSRGCPCQCIYCPIHLSMGYKFRFRTATDVVDEVEYWYKQGYRRFGICDDNFTANKKRVLEICEEIEERKLAGLRLSCDNGIRADCVDYELLKRMKEAGFWRIAYGVEAGNDKILSIIHKGLTMNVIEQAIKDACKLGYTVRLFFLIGSPGETWNDFQDSARLALKYPIFDASFYNVIPYPNTALFEWIKRNGHFKDSPENYLHYASGRVNIPVFYTADFSLRQKKKAFKYAQRISRHISRKALRAKFKALGLRGKLAAALYGTYVVKKLLEWQVSRAIIIKIADSLIKVALEEQSQLSADASVVISSRQSNNQYVSSSVTTIKGNFTVSQNPDISIIIPSLDGYRDGFLPLLIQQLKEQTFQRFELFIIKGDPRQGRAINRGVQLAKGKVLIIMDDDISIGTSFLLENLVKAIEGDSSIGMAGVSFEMPENATAFQKRALRELPRYTFPVVNEIVESDFASHPCCAIPKHIFEAIGGENEMIIRGLDPELRVRLRNSGYKVVIIANSWVYHLPPKSLGKLLKKFFRNGKGSAYLQLYHPNLVYETHTGRGKFVHRRSFIYRSMRYPYRLLRALFFLQFVAFLSDLSYGLGFVFGFWQYGVIEKFRRQDYVFKNA